jgi:hypothetical protein
MIRWGLVPKLAALLALLVALRVIWPRLGLL